MPFLTYSALTTLNTLISTHTRPTMTTDQGCSYCKFSFATRQERAGRSATNQLMHTSHATLVTHLHIEQLAQSQRVAGSVLREPLVST